MEEKKFIIREDLNDIVKSIGFKKVKNKFGERTFCNVVLFNDETIEFRDNENVYKLFQSYMNMGETDFIKSKELVEELKLDDEGQAVGTFVCVKYELKDNTIIRLFTAKFNDNRVIDNYYKLFKMKSKAEKKA